MQLARCASHNVTDCQKCGTYAVLGVGPTYLWKILISPDGTEGMHYSPDMHQRVPDHSCSELCERDVDGIPMRLITEYRWSDNEFETGQLYYDVMGHGRYHPMPEAPPPDPNWNVRRYRLLAVIYDQLCTVRDTEYSANVALAMAGIWDEVSQEERLEIVRGEILGGVP